MICFSMEIEMGRKEEGVSWEQRVCMAFDSTVEYFDSIRFDSTEFNSANWIIEMKRN